MQISENFNTISDKMYCPCCEQLKYRKVLIDKIQTIRTSMSIPFHVNSFYRCENYNSKISGSSKYSLHLEGNAIDISTKGWNGAQKWQFIKLATKQGLSIGVYETFFHVDDRIGIDVLWTG